MVSGERSTRGVCTGRRRLPVLSTRRICGPVYRRCLVSSSAGSMRTDRPTSLVSTKPSWPSSRRAASTSKPKSKPGPAISPHARGVFRHRPRSVEHTRRSLLRPARRSQPVLAWRPRRFARVGESAPLSWSTSIRLLARTLAHPPGQSKGSRPSVDEVLTAVATRHAEWAEPQLIERIAARVTGPDPATIAAVIDIVRAEAKASVDVVDLTAPAVPGDMLRASDGRPVHLPPSAVRYTTRCHHRREVAIVEWAKSSGDRSHRAIAVDGATLADLDDGQAAAVTMMLTEARPVITIVGPAGAGKTHMLAAAVHAWHEAGIPIYGVGPSASSAKQLQDGAGTAGDTQWFSSRRWRAPTVRMPIHIRTPSGSHV